MKTILYYLLCSLFLLGCTNEIKLDHKIESIFNEFNTKLSPGVSVAIVQNGENIFSKGFGLADLDLKIPIAPSTNFRLASITKQFTAFSILLLENDGKLSINDKITKYFPELEHYADRVIIKNILQHTSGLLDYEDFVNKKDSIQLRDKDVLTILVEQDSTYFEPGSKHQYSNSGYAILALLVERVSEMSFAEFLKTKIFKPLKMENTVAYEKGISEVVNRSFGYSNTDSGYVFSDQSLTSAVLGDGGIYSSAIDLLKWNNEINSPTLLPKNKFEKIFEKGKNTKGELFDYGFGWRLDPYKNLIRHYHTGSTSGFSNIYMKLPSKKLTIIVLINIKDYDAKKYAEQIADLFIN